MSYYFLCSLTHGSHLEKMYITQLSRVSIPSINSIHLLKLHEISGWPKIPVLSKSWNEIMVFFLIICSCLLLPIFISCSIYLKLICNKKKWFQNEITFKSEENNRENLVETKADGSLNVELGSNILNSQIERENEIKMQKILEMQQEQKKCQAQILAAERSLNTNLVLGLLFCITFTVFLFVSKNLRVYLTVIVFSVMKAALPLLTTLANFGTVQSVASQYWNYIRENIFHLCKK